MVICPAFCIYKSRKRGLNMSTSGIHIICKNDRENFIKEFNDYLENGSDKYLMAVCEEDTYHKMLAGNEARDRFAEKMVEIMEQNSG